MISSTAGFGFCQVLPKNNMHLSYGASLMLPIEKDDEAHNKHVMKARKTTG